MECINATNLRRKSGPWGTHLLLPVYRKFEVDTTRQLSHPLPVPATKAGCPIQARFWLEWDTTALDGGPSFSAPAAVQLAGARYVALYNELRHKCPRAHPCWRLPFVKRQATRRAPFSDQSNVIRMSFIATMLENPNVWSKIENGVSGRRQSGDRLL